MTSRPLATFEPMNRQQIRELLAVIMAYDNRKPADASVLAWSEAARRGRWTYTEALDAVHEHFATSTAYLLPAHVTERIHAARADAAMREPVTRPDPLGQQRLAELIRAAFRAIGVADHDRDLRREALRRRCPFCGSAPGADCTRTGLRRRQTCAPHPSRRPDTP